MVELKNAVLKAVIDPMGSELKKLTNHLTGVEYLFNADPYWWNGSAPVLFPIIGGLANGVYSFSGKQYALPSHGFARKSGFTVTKCQPDRAVFELRSTAQTKGDYPFDFRLEVSFWLDTSRLTVQYDVTNVGTETMYFSIGSHPAFSTAFAGGSLEEYFIEFEQPEKDRRCFFVDGCLDSTTEAIFDNSRHIFLSSHLFDRGPIILKDVVSRTITIRRSRSTHSVRVEFDAPHVAIWSKPNRAPFVCIEPWWGIPDPIGFSASLEQKPGILPLAANNVFSTRYSIVLS